MVIVLLLIGVILLRFHLASTNLTVTPKVIVVLAGDSTVRVCSCSGTIVTCSHKALNGTLTYFYKNNEIDPRYGTMTNQDLGARNLKMKNVTTAFAGNYECADSDERRQSAELTVIEKLPECSATVVEKFIGPNDCNNFYYEILLSCSVTYHGNKFPDLVLRKSGESTALNSTCTTENNSERICSVKVQADRDMNGSSFVCQTTERAAEEQYKCITEPITTLHSFSGKESEQTTASKGEEVVCNPISGFSCTYKWVWYEKVDDDLSRTIESNNNTLIAKKTGLHRCEAHCKLRNQTCRPTIFTQYTKVIESDGNLTEIKDHLALIHQLLEKEWTPLVIGLLVLGVLSYAAFGCYIFTRKRRKRTLARDRIPASEV